MRILLTNDDGIHAEGLASLQRIAAALSDDAWTIAPEVEQSGMSRALTLGAPLRVRQAGERAFSVTGTPTDCVMLSKDLLDRAPDLVLSGVNRGQNLAEDCSLSGTVAGAVMGMAIGVPAIALSQSLARFHDEVTAHWETAERHGPGVVQRLVEIGWPRDVVMNVNFPARPADEVTEVEVTEQGMHDAFRGHAEKRVDLRGRPYYWMGFTHAGQEPPKGTDLAAIKAGRISVTPLHIDMTHRAAMHDLRGKLGGAVPVLERQA
ncbi:MAG: 5'/3'-nucleotidase SurE [Caulobacteraceae bacterium]|nr:5'/3'-nucleotidase SurE [Caulobacter sp.]